MVFDTYFEETCNKSLEALAYHWAPISFQFLDLKNDYNTKRDLLCQIDFPSSYKDPQNPTKDISWNTRLVRKRLECAKFKDLVPTIYYSVAITDTHYYLLYAFYHADDETHPNDLEGCLVIIKKGRVPKLYGMITIAHHDFVPYVVKNGKKPKLTPLWQKKFELTCEEEEHGANVIVKQTKGKHPLYSIGRNMGFIEWIRQRKNEILGTLDDVIMYIPGEAPTTYSTKRLCQGRVAIYSPTITYQLVDIMADNGMYSKFYDAANKEIGNDTFTKKGEFHTEELKSWWARLKQFLSGKKALGRANGPWLWEPNLLWYKNNRIEKKSDEKKNDDRFKGQIWYDPAKVVLRLFDVDQNEFSTFYQKKMFKKTIE